MASKLKNSSDKMTACYMCRNECIHHEEQLLKKISSFKSLCIHLKISFDEELDVNGVHLCLKCSQELCNFEKLHGDLNVAKMKIHLSLNNILSAMRCAQIRDDDDQCEQKENLRKEIIAKSGTKLGKAMDKVLRQNIDAKSKSSVEVKSTSVTKTISDPDQTSLEIAITNKVQSTSREGNLIQHTAEEIPELATPRVTQISNEEVGKTPTNTETVGSIRNPVELEITDERKIHLSNEPASLLPSSNGPEISSSAAESIKASAPKETFIEKSSTEGSPHFDVESSSDDVQYEDEWEMNANIKYEPESLPQSTAFQNGLMETLENSDAGMPWTSYSYAEGLRRIDGSSDDESIIEVEVVPSDAASTLRRFTVKAECNRDSQSDPVDTHPIAVMGTSAENDAEGKEASGNIGNKASAIEGSYCNFSCEARYAYPSLEDHNIALHLEQLFAHCGSDSCEQQHFKEAVERCFIHLVSKATCHFCNFSVGTTEKYKLRRHLVRTHFKEVEENLQSCLLNWFPGNMPQEDHKEDKKRFFELHEGSYVCNICGFPWKTSNTLSSHLKIHGFDQIKCNYCKESFSRKRDLSRHLLKLHTTELFQAQNVCQLSSPEFEREINATLEKSKECNTDRNDGNKCMLCRDIKKTRIPQQSQVHLIGYHLEYIAGKILCSQTQHKGKTSVPLPMIDVPTAPVSSSSGREVLRTLLQQKLPCRFCHQKFPDHHQLEDHEVTSHCYQLFADCRNAAFTESQFEGSLGRYFTQIMEWSRTNCLFCQIGISTPAQMHAHLMKQHRQKLRTHLVHFQIQDISIPTSFSGVFVPSVQQDSFASISARQPNRKKSFSYNPKFSLEMKRRKVGEAEMSSHGAAAVTSNHAIDTDNMSKLQNMSNLQN